MASKRRVNWISQQRVDVPDMRAVESAVSNDFDELLASFVTGPNNGYVLRGFEISMTGAIGGAASGLQLIVDGGAVFHGASSQSGTFYLVPTGTPAQQLNSATNTIVDGAFAPSAINYVSLEYERYIDDTTSSQVYLWNPTTNNETTKNAPRAQILRYRIRITTSVPASNFLPIAIVTTDSGNNVTRIDNARARLYSQGKGGFTPDPFNTFTWTQGRDAGPTFTTSNSTNPFRGGDQAIGTLKEWMDAVTSSIQEIKGTTYWTSASSSGSLESLRADLGNTYISGRGNVSHDAPETTPGLMNWSEDIYIRVVGSRLAYKLLANDSSTDVVLSDNQVAYIDLTRGVIVTPNLVFTNGSKIIQSVGSISWTSPLQSGDFIKLGSDTDAFYYEIDTVDSLTQVTLLENYGGASTGPGGAKAKYAFGSYETNPAPSTARHIFIADREDVPAGENVFWLFARNDSGGSVARVYVRFLGMEIEDGETEEISDTVPLQLLQYIGSPIESASKPQYVSALNPGSLTQIDDLDFGTAADIPQSSYFLIYSSGNYRKYYAWFNKDGGGVDPEVPGKIGIEIVISTGQTAAQIASAVASALTNSPTYEDFLAVTRPNPNQDIVRVTRTSAGLTSLSVDGNVGVAGLSITQVQSGTGSGNIIVNDGDNLTLAIKKLDEAYGDLLESLDDPTYDEPIDIVTSGETPPTSLNGPVTANTIIDLPDNSRTSLPAAYTVGKGSLEVYLNGQFLRLGVDYDEVGVTDAISSQIEILRQLEVGDVLETRMTGAGAGGGSQQGPPGPQGNQGPPGVDGIGGPVTISTKTADYTYLLGDNVIEGDASVGSANLVFTLPAVASATGRVKYLKKIDASVYTVTLKGNGSELIDQANTFVLSEQDQAVVVISDGTRWRVLATAGFGSGGGGGGGVSGSDFIEAVDEPSMDPIPELVTDKKITVVTSSVAEPVIKIPDTITDGWEMFIYFAGSAPLKILGPTNGIFIEGDDESFTSNEYIIPPKCFVYLSCINDALTELAAGPFGYDFGIQAQRLAQQNPQQPYMTGFDVDYTVKGHGIDKYLMFFPSVARTITLPAPDDSFNGSEIVIGNYGSDILNITPAAGSMFVEGVGSTSGTTIGVNQVKRFGCFNGWYEIT